MHLNVPLLWISYILDLYNFQSYEQVLYSTVCEEYSLIMPLQLRQNSTNV